MAFKKIYGKYRPKNFDWYIQIKELWFNGNYSLSTWTGWQFADYEIAGIIKYVEPIPTEKYTGVLPIIDENENPTGEFIKKQTRFIYVEYSDKYTTKKKIKKSISQVCGQNFLDIMDSARTITWIKANTSLEEEAPGKFIITPAGTDMLWKPIEAVYLTI